MSLPPEGVAGTNYERTFIAIKPDGVQRGLIGEILGRFETKGFKLVAMKLMTPTLEQAQGHYADLSSKKFFGGLCSYFSSGPICAMVWEGQNAIKNGRTLLGATNPADSLPGTIRGDLCIDVGRNICHGSDGPDSAKHEINFWFTPEELNAYTSTAEEWVYEDTTPVVASNARAFPVEETDGRALKNGKPEFRTMDNDLILGKKAPAIGNVELVKVGQWANKSLPKKGTPYVVIFWGQFAKPGYPFLPLYNKLAKKYGDKVNFLTVSLDPDTSYCKKFLEDEKKKYSHVFHCDALAMGFCENNLISEAYGSLGREPVAPVHSYVVDAEGTIVWHQNHAEIGATVPLYIGQVETQIDHILAGEPLEKNGDRVVEEVEEVEEKTEVKDGALGMLAACDGDDY